MLHLAAAAHSPAASQCQQDFWRFWDVLVWVEASIYQMDEDNELLCSTGQAPPQSMIGAPGLGHVNVFDTCSWSLQHSYCAAGHELISQGLQQRGIQTELIAAELAKVHICSTQQPGRHSRNLAGSGLLPTEIASQFRLIWSAGPSVLEGRAVHLCCPAGREAQRRAAGHLQSGGRACSQRGQEL